MAISSCRFQCCFILAMLILVGMSISRKISAAQRCNTDIVSLVLQCEKYVEKSGPKVSPSPGCCALVKSVNVSCVCVLLTKDIQDMISMEKVVFVARSCGKKISPGTICGSYTVPKA
ncbi:hypothetical protein P3X46_030456 [Hevea brasiliensis]|uniref:Bifunctional inhibitor/plant lipid transfer protein/seed storage helical domain-containing protein n=1 Tax=Hevea brasiliensis TaxID=3981 RepID=A0ABQ9KII2_HEVBR|nr:protein LIM3 [Hevea brasiliensis]KAJ9139752.1 hypothetical protein P3X46_030456 [Hevea brasiliensis]